MIRKIILRSQSYWQLIFALLGSYIGVLIVLITVQFYSDLNSTLLKRNDVLGSDYIVVQKKISTLSTLSISSIQFLEEEIDHFRAQKFVSKVGVFKAARFKVFVSISGFENAPDLMTEAFFESIPDEFIDVNSEEWYWNENSEIIPVILPSAYLDAFNFGFGPAQGLPPLSEKAFRLLQLKVVVAASGKQILFTGKIIGFSERLNTILVPEDFLEFANSEFATKNDPGIARIIIAVPDASDPKLAHYIETNNYDTNSNDLKQSRVKTVLILVLGSILVVGGIIVLLSLLSVMQYLQVIIARVQFELKVMMLMGYTVAFVSLRYLAYFTFYFLLILTLAAWSVFYLKGIFDAVLQEYNFQPQSLMSNEVYLSLAILLIFFMLFNGIGIFLQVRRLANKLQ